MFVDAPDTLKRSLKPGQRIYGRVVCAVSPGCYLLRIRGRNLLMQTDLPLQPAGDLLLEVRKLEPLLSLALASENGESPEEAVLTPPFSILT